MKYVYILEDDKKFQKEIIEAVLKIDPMLQLRIFDELKAFSDWIRLCAQEGPLSLAKGGKALDGTETPGSSSEADQLILVISKEEFLGSKWMGLLRKTRQWFIKKKICTPEDPTSLVITAFENPNFDIKLVEDRIINNVIFKPFDKLILSQHLNFAVNGRHPPSEQSLHSMKTSAIIEMLKEIKVEAISEIGMISRSNRPIAVGAVSKYYSDIFSSKIHMSMIAVCRKCIPHPVVPTEYQCEFSFFACDPGQISSMRKLLFQKKEKEVVYSWLKNSEVSKKVQIVAIEADEKEHDKYAAFFKEYFTNIELTLYKSFAELLSVLEPKKPKLSETGVPIPEEPSPFAAVPAFVDVVVCDQLGFNDNYNERWEKILNLLSEHNKGHRPSLFMTSNKNYNDSEQKEFAAIAQEIFMKPFDASYLARKMKYFIPSLVHKEAPAVHTRETKAVIKVANPIQVSELSEAGLVMAYYRPISIGAFREFILWRSKEIDNPELLGACNYVVGPNQAGMHENHFVFFGITDGDLKHIRMWIRDNYINSKEAA